MSETMLDLNLDYLFRPRSVAFVGASANPKRLSGRPLRLLRRHGYSGNIYIVHPVHDEIDGIPAVRSVAELPEAPDVVVITVPATLTIEIAEECGKRGVRHLVIMSSGFEETSRGKELAEELSAIARRYGMSIVGPNSEGLWFVPGNTILTFGSAADRDRLVPGPVAVLSQSGSIGASIIRQLNDSGYGANAFVSLGNETVLEATDYLDWLVQNGDVRVVVCFLEGLRNGRRFLLAANRARAAGIAVVVLHAGQSADGRAASASHTGKISSSAVIYRSAFDQAGVLQVDTLSELASSAVVLSGRRLPSLSRKVENLGLTVIGLSGGSRSIIADAAAELGVPLARLSKKTTEELATFIPEFGAVENPVDPTGQVLNDQKMFPRTIEVLASDESTEAMLVQYANGGMGLIDRHLTKLIDASSRYKLPIVVGALLDDIATTNPTKRALLENDISLAVDPTDAVRKIALLYRLRDFSELPPVMELASPRNTRRVTSWGDLGRWSDEFGISPPREVVLPTGLTSGQIKSSLDAAGIGFPVVAKASPDDVSHKSEAGLVHLSLVNTEQVRDAIIRIVESLGSCSGILVQEQLQIEVELLVVLAQDADFGPVMGIGLGGYFVELFAEIGYVVLPSTPEQVARVIRKMRAGKMLEGYRGHKQFDINHIAASLAKLGEAYTDLVDPPTLIELNPIAVLSDGSLRVLDSLIETIDING